MSDAPGISAIIVNWNGAPHLRVCLPSLLAQTWKSLEIIVVDNGSRDDSETVAREFGVKWLPLECNVGLAPALNRGAKIARGQMLLFVNNDMRFDAGFITALAAPLQGDDRIFATDGMQFNWEGTVRAHEATRLTTHLPTEKSAAELVPGLYFYPQPATQNVPVFMGSAACMLVRKSLFEQLNGFDERLPLGYEDVEICSRAWLRGWPTVFVPAAICWHRIGASGRSQQGADFNFRGVLTGRLLFATKLLPSRYVLRTWMVSIAAIAKDLAALQWQRAANRIRILSRMATWLPKLLREKRKLFQDAGSTPEQHLRAMLALSIRK